MRHVRQQRSLLLLKANRSFTEGDYLKAADCFEKLASEAAGRNAPRAPYYYLRAGRALMLAEKVDEGMILLMNGLQSFIIQKRFLDFERAGSQVVSELQEGGLKDQAVRIDVWMKEQFAGISENGEAKKLHPTLNNNKPLLPVNCPSCGGAIHPEQVVWVDEATVECSYCGNLI